MNGAPLTTLAVALSVVGSLFAGADAAVASLADGRLEVLAKDENGPFARYQHDRRGILSRWLIARVIALCSASALLCSLLCEVMGSVRVGTMAAVAVSVAAYGLFAEAFITVARQRPEGIARIALRFLRPIEIAVWPIAAPFSALARVIEARVPEVQNRSPEEADREVELLVDEGQRSGAIAVEPAELIRNVLDFKDLTARQVMIPRRRVSGIEVSIPLDKAVAVVSSDRHSRYPVYRETLDNVIGLLYAKDLFDVVRKGRTRTMRLGDVMRKNVLFVAGTQPALSVLREMRAQRLHMAIVTDEFGGTGGIVTLEDVIEEIVGEIHDEHDTDEDSLLVRIGEDRYVADASIPLGDLESIVGELSSDGNYESLGGLVVARMGRVPEVGAELRQGDHRLIVREADEKRVLTVEIVRYAPESMRSLPPDESEGVP